MQKSFPLLTTLLTGLIDGYVLSMKVLLRQKRVLSCAPREMMNLIGGPNLPEFLPQALLLCHRG